jgi:hypothetical protein
MTWFFEGTGRHLGLGLGGHGSWSAYGTCSQSCRPQAGDSDIHRYVRSIEGSWSLDALETNVPCSSGGHSAIAKIQYFNADNDFKTAAVTSSIRMTRPAFDEVISLFKTIIGNASVTYVIALGFLGLVHPGVQDEKIPNVDEFVNAGRPYLSSEVSISVRSFSVKDGT